MGRLGKVHLQSDQQSISWNRKLGYAVVQWKRLPAPGASPFVALLMGNIYGQKYAAWSWLTVERNKSIPLNGGHWLHIFPVCCEKKLVAFTTLWHVAMQENVFTCILKWVINVDLFIHCWMETRKWARQSSIQKLTTQPGGDVLAPKPVKWSNYEALG